MIPRRGQLVRDDVGACRIAVATQCHSRIVGQSQMKEVFEI
jgi:hypothetical protein